MAPRLVEIGVGTGDHLLVEMPIGVDGRNEAWVRDFLLAHPAALPLGDIDPAFAGAVPICRELRMPSGRIDAFFATSTGGLVVVECKLWRNPEARREVIGQILDYAKDLASFRYEDLQREVSISLGRPGENALFAKVAEQYPGVDEARFVDHVARNLSMGRFMLLIVGDGIHRGVEAIAQYVATQAGLHFTLGLVELAAYRSRDDRLFVQPRVLARTVNIERTVVRWGPEAAVASPAEAEDPVGEPGTFAQGERRGGRARFDPVVVDADRRFWQEFRRELKLDDPGQPTPVTGFGRARFDIVPGTAWINVYSARRDNAIGAGCVFKGDVGRRIYDMLLDDREAIDADLAGLGDDDAVQWGRGAVGPTIYAARYREGDWTPANEEENLRPLLHAANRMVNVFRPRVLRAAASLA